MPTPEELQSDTDFMSATPADQIGYLSHTDPDFKAAKPEDQAAYLAHVTKQPTGAESVPAPGLGGALDVANKQYEGPGVVNAMGRLGTMVPNMARQAYHAATDPLTPAEQQEGFTHRGPAMAAKRAVLDPSQQAWEHVDTEAKAQEARFKAAGQEVPLRGKLSEAVGKGLSVLPFVGPYAIQLGERAGKGDVAGAVTEALGVAATPEIAEEAKPGGALPGAPKMGEPAMPTMNAGIRTVGKGLKAAGEHSSAAGAAIGGVAGALEGGPAGAAYGTYTGGRVGKIVSEPLVKGGEALSKVGMTEPERAVAAHEDAVAKTDKAVLKAEKDHAIYKASEAAGPIDPDANPAYKKSLDTVTKAKIAQAEAHYHLQEAKLAAEQAKAPVAPDQAITPEAVAAARPAAPSPTNEDINARQEKLMGQMETAAGVEKPAAPSKTNVQPEVFPQEPTAVPRVEETTRPRMLAGPEGQQGVIQGRAPRMLTEGVPAAVAPPEAPKEAPPIMTAGKPERPSMAGLKVDETGKVIDTRAGAQTEAEKALVGGPGTKMVRATEGKAVPPEGPLAKYTPEKPVEAPKAETLKVEAPKAAKPNIPTNYDASKDIWGTREKMEHDAAIEARAKAEAPKTEPGLTRTEKEIKNEGRSPEDETRIQDVIKDHSDQELARLGTKYGLDESKYDFSARDENRHRVERDQFVKDLMEKMPDEDKDKLAHLTAEFDNKDSKMWSDAERSALNKAQRARAIMQEFRGGAATVAGGKPADVRAQVGVHNANGGSTFHPEEGDLKGKPFFAVGGEPEFRDPKLKMTANGGELTAEQIKEFTERPEVKAALAKHPDASVGTWHDQAADKTVVELVKTPADRAEAIKMGTANGEKAIYDLKEGKEIPTGGTGEGPKGGNITLHHWSGMDGLTETDPEKFGTNKAGAEKERSKEEGFLPRTYFGDAAYKEPAITSQKNHYTAEVDPDKYYDIAKDPDGIWQKGFKEGGATAAENAVHDAGYHGYFHDGGYVSFEKVPVKSFEEPAKAYKDMTSEEQEALAAKGQSGASGAAAKPAKTNENMSLPEEAEKYLRPEEKEGVLKSQAQRDKFVQHMTELPSAQEFIDAAKKGEGGRKWYQRSTQAFNAMVKEAPGYFDQPADQQKFTGLLAAGSPQQSVVMNMREALNVWQNYVDAGRPTGKALEKLLSAPKSEGGFTLPGAKVPNAMKALAGEPLWPDISKNKNFKVPSFEANLRGMLDRVTNDGWMGLFSGIDAKGLASPHSYHPISVATRAAADALGWEPAEAQAAIWAFIKTFTEKGEAEPENIRKYSEDFVDILKNDPETRGILNDMGVNRGELDKRLAAIEAKPKITSGASDTAEDSLRRTRERVEKARGAGVIPAPKSGNLFDTEEPDEGTEFNPEKFGESNEETVKPKGTEGHTYEYEQNADSHQVTVRDADGNSVALVSARAAEDAPNKWTVKTSASAEKGEGLKGYARLMDAAQSQAERSGEPVTVWGDTEMSPAAVRTWAKLGEQYEVAWHKDNRPSVTLRPTKMSESPSKMKR